jgi:hypothetical protein
LKIRVRAAASFLAIVAAFCACEMSAEVTTSVSAGGRATFGFLLSFDKQLLDVARGTPQGAKALEDLNKIPSEFSSGGWTFRKTVANGGLRIETRRRFSNVGALNSALTALRSDVNANSSATVALITVFKEFEIQRTPGFLKSETRVSGLVDVTIASLFGGTQIAPKDQQTISDIFTTTQAFTLRVRADLAGKITSATGGPRIKGASAVWTPKFGEQLRFSATASAYNPFALMAIGLPLAGGLAWGAVRLVSRRRRARTAVPGWEVGVTQPAAAKDESPAPSSATSSAPTTPPPDAG